MLNEPFDPPIRLRQRHDVIELPAELATLQDAALLIPKLPRSLRGLHWSVAGACVERSVDVNVVRRALANAFETDGMLDPSDPDAVRG